MRDKKILVPTDFTEVARCAINHAIKTAETINGSVTLLHVVAAKDKVAETRKKLSDEVALFKSKSNVPIDSLVRVGNIFDDIGDAAAELDAELIFMGTHGMKGMQFITGSHALKVVKNSKPPFIVVQDRDVQENGYDDIVVPLDLSKQTKQKLHIVANMAKYFNSKLHLITPKETDEFLKNQLDRNLKFAKNFLKEKGIDFTTTISEEKGGNFAKVITKFAAAHNADLIAIMNLHENSLMGMLGNSYEQQLITNDAEIPVMCINPYETTVAGGSVLFS